MLRKSALALGIAALSALLLAPGAHAQGTTPQLTKTFTPNQVQVGETTTLQFSITNPAASPQSWSFTDQLPQALKVARSTPTANTCAATTVTAPLDSHQIQVAGQVPGSGSCAVSMLVQVVETGTHTNDAGNITNATNITPPSSSTQVQCADADDPPVDDMVGVFVDCDFSDEPPANNFTIKQDWQSATNTVAYQTPVVGDLFGTGDPAIVSGGNRAATGGDPVSSRLANDLHVYDGATGDVLHTITTPRYSWSSFAAAAIADVDDDGRGEIIFRTASHSQTQADANAAGVPAPADIAGRLVAYKYDPGGDDWDVMWVSDKRYDQGPAAAGNQARGGAATSLADFNGDGTPEVYVGNEIFNARTGVRVATGAANQPSGCQGGSAGTCLLAQTVAVDTDGDGDLELAAGDSVYDVQITNPNGEAGNSMTIAETADTSNANAKDGMTAVADMDLDGAPEIVVVVNGTTTATTVLYVWDPETGAVEGMKTGAQMTGANGTSGGPPMIGDIDGDARPEIVMVTTNRLRAFDFVPGAATLVAALPEIWTLTVSDGSGGTSMSMFDFNNDGEQEIVYRDEANIRIIDGGPTPPNTTNRNLASFGCTSGTSVDMPVIADITGTGEARIVVTCGGTTQANVRAYETNSFPWANTRPVWNQQAYFVTHINDDLTVPSQQFPNWTVFNDPDQRCSDGANRPLNNFQVQVTDLDSETGCPVICVPPSLEIDKTSDPESGEEVEPGETIEYTITIENTSSDDVTDVDVTDDLTEVLDDATITSGPTVTPPGAGTAQITGNELAFNGTIPDGATVTITYEATVNPRSQLGDRNLGNSVIGEFSNCDGITGVLRCTTEHPVAVPRTDLELEKSGDAVVGPGDPVTYTLTVTNHGPDDSTGSTVTDTLPAGLTNVQVPQNCQLQGQTLTCDVGPLADGDSTDIVITADAPNTPSTCFENDASVEADDDDLDASNDGASARTCTTPAADLEIEKSSSPQVVSQGGQVTYEIAVNNNGPDDAHNVVVTDTLPNGLTNIQAGPGCNVQGQVLTCNFALLQPNNPQILLVTANAPNTPSTCFDNVASVEADEGDPDLSNNESDPARTCTTPAADLEIEKTGPATVDTGGQVTYTLTVTNNGPDSATNVIVSDDLPAGLTNIQAPGCNIQSQTVTCNLGNVSVGSPPPIQITATAPQSGSTCFDNVATVEGDEGDPDISNNESDEVRTCTRESDLELAKTVSPQVVDPGDPVTYTLTVTNNGPDDSPGSTVTDNLPAGLTNIQVPQGCQLQGSQVTCTVGAIDADDSTDIVITADSPNTPATCFENDATVDGASDPTSGNDDASARACTTPAADLELEKAGPAEVDPGGQVTWTLTVTNNGPQQSSGSTVTDTLPNSITNIQVPQGCALQGAVITCDVGPIDADDSVDIVITGDAPNDADTCFSNDASVEIDDDAPDEVDPNPDNNDATAETCTNEGADLAMSKVAAPGPYNAGDDVTYTLTVTNNGPATAHDVEVTDDLPASLTFVSATPDQGTCNSADPVDCDLGTLAPTDTVEIELVATIGANQSGNQIDNTACAEATEPDSETDDNCDTEPIDVEPEADVEIAKAASAGPHFAGDNVTYTLTVDNNGPNAAADVEVTDDLPGSLTFVSATPSQGSCNNADPVDCDLGTIAANGQATIDLVVTIGQNQSGNQVDNTACADTSTADPEPANDCDTEPIDVEPEADVEMAKVASAGPHSAGDNVTYTLTVDNNGPNDAADVEVTDDLPASLTFVSATPSQGTCNAADPLDCDLGTIAANGQATIDLVATIGADQSGNQIENTACAETSTLDPESNNDCDTEPIDVDPEADLEVVKTADPGGNVEVGELLTYTLTVTNHGPNDATDVELVDDFQGAVKVESVTPSQGTCQGKDPITCQLGTIADGDQASVEVRARPLHDGELENTATVDSPVEDPDPTNNDDLVPRRIGRTGDVDVEKRANRSKAGAGDIVTYKIIVTSKSQVALRNLKVCDTVPKQLKLVRAPGAEIHGNTACWRFDLSAGAKKTFKVRTKVKPSRYPLRVKNTAKLEGGDVQPQKDREGIKVQPSGVPGAGPCPAARPLQRC